MFREGDSLLRNETVTVTKGQTFPMIINITRPLLSADLRLRLRVAADGILGPPGRWLRVTNGKFLIVCVMNILCQSVVVF